MSKLCKRILLILAVFSSFLTLFACSAIQIDTYHVELPQDKYQLRVGQEIEALPIVSKNGQECDLEVSYHSYDASIATYVDGKIVALKSGEVRIKVTLKNNSKVYATALVTVVNDDSLIVDFNYEKTMIKGTTQLLTYELLVEKNRKLTFTSSNENVATIDELGNIKAITVGTTTIETVVSSLYDEGVSKTYKLVIEVKDLTFAINYVLDGGTNSENNPNEYVPEKLPLLLENPTKSGYKFVGWYDNENFTGEAITEISAGTMGDVTLYAKWNALDYRISYELNGGTNAENPDGYDVSDLPVSLHAPSRTGYIFKGWYMGENRVLAIPVGTTGNVVVSAKWEPITYTIDFDTNGGLPTLSSIEYTIESDSFTLQEITKVGYTFDGWYNGETKVTEITTGTYGNMTLVAKWTADLYTISYDLADGVNSPENPTSYTIESGLITLKDPTREGYTFAGWYNGEQLVTTIDSNTLENISLTAKWTVNSYKLTFDVDGNLTEKTFKYGETVVAIENPTKVGHTFAGWSEELPETMPANDITVEATWTVNSYKLTFDVDGNLTEKTFKYGESVTAIENPTKVGYTFAGWSEELPVKMPANDLYVSAIWTVNSYKLTFDVDENLTEKTFKYGESVTAIENPTKVGYTFAGWSKEIPATMPAEDLTVKATWTINSYKLTLDVDGNLTEKTFKYGESVTAIENPTKEGHTFAGWSKEIPATMPAEDLTVKATWTINSYKLTLDVDGNLTEKTFKYGESVTAIENPTKVGYTFAGWSPVLPETMPAEDLTVKATWTVNSHDITYDFAGGEFKNVDYLNTPLHKFAITDYLTYQAGTGAEIALMKTTPGIYWVYILLKNTNNDGLYEIVQIANGNANVTAEYDYVIAWHDGLTDTSAKSILQKMLASSSSYIGGYVKLSNVPSNKTADCNITAEVYKASDIVINDPLKTSYTIEDSVELPTPSKTGYVFDGWYVNGTKLENIALGSTGNLVLKAQWKVIVYNISLNPDGGKAKYSTWDEFAADFLKDFCTYVWNNPTKITSAAYFWGSSYSPDTTVQAKIISFFTDNAEKWGFLSDELDAGVKKANWTKYDKTHYYYYRCNLTEYLTKTKRTEWPESCGAFDGMSDPAWISPICDPKYATWDEFVADFLKDFCTYVWNNPTKITSAAYFWGSSYSPDTTVQAKIISFFTDNAEKWGFLSDELDAGVKKANWTKYDKTHYYYYRCNLTEYLTKTKRTEWPESCGAFDGMSDPAWVGYYELNYTVDDNIMLPQLYKEGYTFLGWFNGDNKVDMIKAGTTGNLNLVAKWEKIKVYHDLNLDLDGGTLDEVPTQYLEGEEFILPIPTKEGYTFLGWYNGSEKVEKISATEASDISLVAKWKITTDHEGTEDDPYSVDDALKVAGTLSSGEYTDLVYITGVVTDAGTFGTYYKNVYICDKNSNEIKILVYTCNISEIVDVIYVNDTVVIKGYIKNHNGNTLEISSKGNSYATFVSKEAGLSTITVSETSSEFAIISELSTMKGLNGSSFTFKVSVTEGYEIVCVKVNGVEITPNNDVYTATISGNTIISVETKVKGAKDPESIVSLTFPDENKANNKISSYEKNWTAKIGTYEWTITGFNNNSWNNGWTYIKAGKKDTPGVANISTKFAEIITSITITVDSIKTNYINSMKLIISENADGSNALEEISLDLKKGVNEIKISKATKNCYYILTFDINSNTSKNGTAMQISKLEYTGYKADSSDPSKTHNISYVNLPEGATNSNPTSYTEGKTITLVDPVLPGYTFEGWYDNAECTGTKIIEISGYTTDIILYAKGTLDSGTKTTKWKLVTDASELSAGDEIVIASNSKDAITGKFDSSKKYLVINTTDVTFNDAKTEITSNVDSVSIYILGGEADAWTLTNSDGKLLGAKKAKEMALGSGTTTWKITIASNNATISSTNSSYGKILYNVNYPRFLNYNSDANAGMLLPQIYKKVVE